MNNWTKDAVFYHIYPLGFCGCEQYHQESINHRILKLKEWIPHLVDMHINAVYLGPVFESYEHGYDTSDYRMIDHRLGTNEDFKEVCDALHEAGIRIVLDGVFNHVGRRFWAFLDVIEKGQASCYCSWFHNLNFYGQSPCGDPFTYDAWEGHYNLVKLNLRNEEVVSYLLESIAMWMDEFHIDGLRLDAADCIDQDFFRRLKQFCKEKAPDFWLMGEIIHGDYNRWANDEMLDSVTNYECYKGLYSSHNEKNYFEIAYSLNRQFGNGGIYRNLNLYNFVDNHDVNRLASTLKDSNDLKNVYTMLYTMPGIPSIYYGSEWAVKGTKHDGSDADIRPCLPLEDPSYDEELCEHIAMLGKIYGELSALRYGAYEQLVVRNEQFAFMRKDEKTHVVVAFNVSDDTFTMELPCAAFAYKDMCKDVVYLAKDNHIELDMEPKSAYILIPCADNEKGVVKKMPKKIIKEEAPEQEVMPLPETKEEQAIVLPVIDMPITPGVYEHFKGKHYTVLYVAKHSETLESYVVYRQLYGNGEVWIRPLDMFLKDVEVDGKIVPRFKYIGK
ncbi:DUF1653 domain-containing protein [Absiella sp. AM54-8XD]|uniref:DUF1653 domain-containing protein n=2 Tax=Amedibacillus TaxID=2749846 RepID=A0A7G9GKB5_9FIRM|nr:MULTISPECIES: DUF1653 domain-containing protein [Bacillota]QNM11247.1 DUF1653 domain-containing protein [[Eubacterium] hominis]MCH4284700.1 DUF1653 domain-containing protein [Amedibacillus hominis]RGB52539.1 DUF1653 domain-containing protein [Absiella sp. AM22-9]RGB54862.1 DUF1653 domain-containing protein [Absiella sp. AM10-20]RGC23498.1 DUF1653 domain-containing protein [Absiella sp. AM54-8XD]